VSIQDRRTRVLIAEDSEAMRATLRALIDRDPRLQVIGIAVNGREAVAMAKSLRPDVITMDIVMPQLDGVEATAQIMSDDPMRILIISSYVESRQVDLSFRAMAAGALEVVAKPVNSHAAELNAWATRLCEAIVLMAEVPVIRRHRRRAMGGVRAVDAVGIVASTGGPLALSHILGLLPADLPVPLLVAQHIAEGFTDGLVRWLQRASRLRVAIAVEGAAPQPGNVYFPPEQRDLELGDDNLLHAPKPRDRYTPSGDRLLASLAHALGPRACGVVLTGMGEDGAAGLLAIRNAGGMTFAQSPSSCVVWGMPQAAMARNATTELRSLEGVAEEIVQLSGRKEAR
jgi:two-component system chemotaxis response regulator CheB